MNTTRRLFLSILLTIPLIVSGLAHSAPPTPKIIMGVFSGPTGTDMANYDFRDGIDGFAKKLSSIIGIRAYPEMYQSLQSVKVAAGTNELGLILMPAAGRAYPMAHGYTPILMSVGMTDDVVLKNKLARVIKTAFLTPDGTILNKIGRLSLVGHPGVKVVTEETQGAIVNALKFGAADVGSVNGEAAKELLATGRFEVFMKAPPMPSYALLIKTSLLAKYGKKMVGGAGSFSPAELVSLQTVMSKPLVSFTKYDESSFLSFNKEFGQMTKH